MPCLNPFIHSLKSSILRCFGYRLINQGVSVHSKNSEGATPLHWAAFKGHVDVAKVLLRKEANVNAVTKKGSTTLRLATTHKQQEMVRFLKSRGGRILD
ncbi:MAG: hypothetical protein GJ680_17830 [Alteromonadaceae bacterium]|nr:hypothetical protein [Alteromonadaceae bacterium]